MGIFVKQRKGVETESRELAAQLAESQGQNDFFRITIRALFYFIKEFSLDLTEIGSEAFKDGIDAVSRRFTRGEKTKKLQSGFEESKHLILAYIQKEKDYFRDREQEFKNIIDLLSSGIRTISEENESFHVMIYKNSTEFEKLTQLDDIRKIKEQLRREIETMRQSIRDKQSQDAHRLEALVREVESLKVDFRRAKRDSMTDGLTGVFNRAAFDNQITKMVDRNTVSATPFVLLLLDIDNFKHINDTYGHPVGDRVILAVAHQCQALLRQDDFLARYGGEEFAIILTPTALRHGLRKARAMVKAIASTRYAANSQQGRLAVSFTVSIGVSAFHSGDTVESVIERADQALYAAKKQGKNRAVSEKLVGV